MNYSIACANEYKSRVRLGRLAMLQERTLGAIHERSVKQTQKNRRYLYGLIAILIILVFALVFIIMQMRQLRRSLSPRRTRAYMRSSVVSLSSLRSTMRSSGRSSWLKSSTKFGYMLRKILSKLEILIS